MCGCVLDTVFHVKHGFFLRLFTIELRNDFPHLT
jgi:hypothetical protein